MNNIINRKKISIALKGKKKSPEHVSKIAEKHAKCYKVITPDGRIDIIKNLSKYCKENNLHTSNMCQVARGKMRHYKGYYCEKMEKEQ